MDGKTFAKVCKDCQVNSKTCTPTDVDLIFAQVKEKAARRITYPQFERALAICASKRKETTDQLTGSML